MIADHHLLLAADDSEASHKAVSYVAGIVGASPRFRIRLLHVLPCIPAGLLEHGGCDPGVACPAEEGVRDETVRWRQRCERAAAGLMEQVRSTLVDAGVALDRIEVLYRAPLPEDSIGYHILQAAVECGCDTVVVGRAPRSWLADALHRSPSHALLGRDVRGLAVWIVT